MKRLTITLFGEDESALQNALWRTANSFSYDHPIAVADAVRKYPGNEGPAIGRWVIKDVDTEGDQKKEGVGARNVCSACGSEVMRCKTFSEGIFWAHTEWEAGDHDAEVAA